MAQDTRADEGAVYPGGKVVAKGRTTKGGDMRHDEFSSIDPETVSIYELATILKGN